MTEVTEMSGRTQGRGTHVVVLGAGYAGVMAANRVRASLTPTENNQVRVTVVNPVDRFVERIRLHQLVAGSADDATVPLADVLHDDVAVLLGTASRIDVGGRRIHVTTTTGEQNVTYDQLVYAVGSAGAGPSLTEPGAAAHKDAAHPGVAAHQGSLHPEILAVADHAAASRAHAVIAAANGAGSEHSGDDGGDLRVTVVGGGLSGIETAAEIAERPGVAVTLVTSGVVGPGMRPTAQRRISRRLERLGVTLREGVSFRGTATGAVVLDDGTSLPTDLCLWAGALTVPPLARDSGLPTDPLGRLVVGRDLRCATHPEIVGAGDAVVLPPDVGGHLRMSCAAAMPLGAAAAATVLATLRGEPAPHASVGHLLQCLSLGRRDGYVQVVHADDTPRGLALTGPVGARIKEAVCAMTLRVLRAERDRPGSYRAPRGPRRTSLPDAVSDDDARTPTAGAAR